MDPSEGKSLRVLIVDDEKNIRTTLAVCLEGVGCLVTSVGTGQAALAALGKAPFELAFVDLRLDKLLVAFEYAEHVDTERLGDCYDEQRKDDDLGPSDEGRGVLRTAPEREARRRGKWSTPRR